LNLSKSGISYSFGGRHAWLTLGYGRMRTSVGIPGTGLYWYEQHRLPRPANDDGAPLLPRPHRSDWIAVVMIVATILVTGWALTH